VLQRYISSPFLLSGRKFDIRCWVLLDGWYRPYLYRQAVCRTSSAPYSVDNLADTFVHLTNHCIQEKHPDFAKGESGNELFLPGMQEYLDRMEMPAAPSPLPPHRLCVICHLLPQLRHVVAETLASVRVRMEVAGASGGGGGSGGAAAAGIGSTGGSPSLGGDYASWQLFGYDLMLDSSFHVRLLEINATPASAAQLLVDLVTHLRGRAIEPHFPSEPRADPIKFPASSPRAAAVAAPICAAPPSVDEYDAAACATARASPPPLRAGSGSARTPFSCAQVLSRPCSCASFLRGLSKAAYLAPADRSINLFDPL